MIMKKQILLFVMVLLPMIASADAVEINGIYYNLVTKAKEAEVTSKPNRYSGEVIIPESVEYEGTTYCVTSIGENAFYLCYNLTSVTIPNNVTSIGYNAFCGCKGLNSLIIPNSVTYIEHHAFQQSGLTSIIIPSSVTTIKNCVFANCSKLSSVTIPNSVTSIWDQAFWECTSLTTLSIPNSVSSIYPQAFYNCSALTSITIGCNVSSIYGNAFEGCSKLTDVYCYAEKIPTTYADVFKDSYIGYATLHVPAASINDYKTTEPWKNFKEIVPIGDGQIDQCATPTIAYENGKITFSCETDGVEYVSEIKAADAKKYYDGNITLTNTYTVSVYATKEGYVNSDVATLEIHPTNIGEGGSCSGETGDVNGDKKVDVSDIVKIVNIIMNGSGTPSDEFDTSKITASFGGGAYSSINGVIQSGSQLMWRFSNNSTECVTLTGIQLINGLTGAEGNNMLTENVEVVAGETKGYTITVGVLGIQQPKVRFTYQHNNKTYTVEAAMPDQPQKGSYGNRLWPKSY